MAKRERDVFDGLTGQRRVSEGRNSESYVCVCVCVRARAQESQIEQVYKTLIKLFLLCSC